MAVVAESVLASRSGPAAAAAAAATVHLSLAVATKNFCYLHSYLASLVLWHSVIGTAIALRASGRGSH